LALAVIGLVVSALGALVSTRTVSNTGTIRIVTPPPSPSPSPPPSPPPSVQLGIYSDSGCTTVLSSIPWGTLDPGSTATSTIYVRNEGNVPATLSVQASNWNPASAQSFFTLAWNRNGYVLAVGASVQAVLNLTVSSSISGITTFSFDITIAGSG
jgi:hypothetical protein